MLTTYNSKNSCANKTTNTTPVNKPNPTLTPITKLSHQIKTSHKSSGSRPNISWLNSKNNTKKPIKKFNYFQDKETRNLSHFKKTNSNSRKDSKSHNNSKINLLNWPNLSPSKKKSSLKIEINNKIKIKKDMRQSWKMERKTTNKKTPTRKDKSKDGSFPKAMP